MRGVLAVLAGLGVVMVLVVVLTWMFATLMDVRTNEPTMPYIISNVAVNIAAAIVGGYLTGRIAEVRPLLYGSVLGVVLLLLSLPMMISGPQLGQPEWYPMSVALSGLLGAIAGGALARRATPNTEQAGT